MRQLSRAWVWVLVLPWVVLWPAPRIFGSHLLAAADQEAATHTWGLWAALTLRQPLLIETGLLGHPEGASLVLVDPGNLPAFALGLLGGPAAAYNAVLVAGVALAGAAGALLARQVDGNRVVGAAVGLACPTLLSNAADGMTEGFGVGWVGLFVAFVLRWRDHGAPRSAAAAVLCLAMSAWTGPYNGVWAALAGLAIGISALVQRQWAALRRLLTVATAALPLVAPLAWALFSQRAEALPGSASRAGLPPALAQPDLFRGGLRYGADLLDPWAPVQLTGGQAPVSHTAYLGLTVLVLAGVAVARDRKLWPWLAGAAAFAALSLGPRLYAMGQPLQFLGRDLLGPAGLLILGSSFFGRITRWYRAGAVASLLLAPLASRAVSRSRLGPVVALAVVLDTLLLAPLAWPLHHAPLPDGAPFQALVEAEEGALLELPPVTSATPPPGAWRDQTGLLQPQHRRPTGSSLMGLPIARQARAAQATVEGWLREGTLSAEGVKALERDGFRWLAVYPRYRPMPPGARGRLEACFGAAVGASDTVWVFDLGNAPETGCHRPKRRDHPDIDTDGTHK